MFNRNLFILLGVNVAVVMAFVISFGRNQSLVPLFIGLLPLVVCNFICVREFIVPRRTPTLQAESDRSAKKTSSWTLLILPVMVCVSLRRMIQFDSELGWSPIICFGFSVLLCLVIISVYGSIKTNLASRRIGTDRT